MDASPSTNFNHRLRQERVGRNWRQQDLADQLGTTVVTIKRWERGSQCPSAYFRVKLCALFGKSAEELGLLLEDQQPARPAEDKADTCVETPPPSSSADFPNLWAVPYARNPFFTGREELLRSLYEKLNREHSMALTQSWAISGLGGIGKTQIALEYAYQYRQNYSAVFWISAATRETLQAGIITIAELLQLPEKDEQDQEKVLQAVKRWLTTHQKWLLILDNVDDVAIAHNVVPPERPGHLLLTTRVQALGTLAQRIEVETMGIVEATLFLLRRAKILAADGLLEWVSEKDLAGAEAVAIEMDFLPLALDQAGAYIEEVGCSLSAYLDLYRTHRKDLLQHRGQMPTDHPEPVTTTWSLSFQKIEQTIPAAAELLRLCAFLEPDAIPEELIGEGAAQLGPVLESIAKNAFKLNEAIEALRKFSLLQRNPETKMLRIHRLVQAVLKDAIETEEQRQWAERVVRATNAIFPESVEMVTSSQCRRYLPQAQICTMLIQNYAFAFVEAASLLYRTACYLRDYALYEQAEPLFQRAIQIREQELGLEHLLVAEALHGLADLYLEQGKYSGAEALFERALRVREQELGVEHPLTATSLDRFGHLYYRQGKYEQAEPLLLSALHTFEQALGPDHPQVASPLNNLGRLYWQQGKYEQAEPLLLRASHIFEQVSGPEHPQVASPLANLGTLYWQQGRYELAETFYQRALHIYEQAFGPEHPQAASPLHGLGILYCQQGKYELAEIFYQRALHIYEQMSGFESPQVTYPLNSLGLLYCQQGKYELAESALERALRVREQAFGPAHPQVTYSLNSLGRLYWQQGKYELAESFYRRALCIRERTFGPDHPMLAEPLNGLANLYREQDRYEQAEAFYQRVLILRQQHLGPQHPDVAETLHDLAYFYRLQQQTSEAVSHYQHALAIREQALGPLHPKTEETRNALTKLLQEIR